VLLRAVAQTKAKNGMQGFKIKGAKTTGTLTSGKGFEKLSKKKEKVRGKEACPCFRKESPRSSGKKARERKGPGKKAKGGSGRKSHLPVPGGALYLREWDGPRGRGDRKVD